MRGDVFVREVVSKCESLKEARMWPPEPTLRPRAWLENFEPGDQPLAALLLDRFTYYSDELTNRLLLSAYNSTADGLPKGPAAPDLAALSSALPRAIFTRVDGEEPRPTDSGNLFCRKARQLLDIPDERFVEPAVALRDHASAGAPVVFLDDFVGSGDQFLSTWYRPYERQVPQSFSEAYARTPFVAVYLTLVSTKYGLGRIATVAPMVAVSVVHVLEETDTVRSITTHPAFELTDLSANIGALVQKYAPRLTPPPTIAQNPDWVLWGYKSRALTFAFEHSVPDATLPIFWSPGTAGWTPLLRRT